MIKTWLNILRAVFSVIDCVFVSDFSFGFSRLFLAAWLVSIIDFSINHRLDSFEAVMVIWRLEKSQCCYLSTCSYPGLHGSHTRCYVLFAMKGFCCRIVQRDLQADLTTSSLKFRAGSDVMLLC